MSFLGGKRLPPRMCSGYLRPSYQRCKCGELATCWGATSGFLCANCALEEWNEMSEREQLELLGFDYDADGFEVSEAG